MSIQQQSGWNHKAEIIKPEDAKFEVVFGVGNAKPIDWRPHAPEQEDQRRSVYCLIFSYLNSLEMMAKKAGIKVNFSERWIVAHLIRQGLMGNSGTNFNHVADTARTYLLIKESELSFEDNWLENTWNFKNQIKNISSVNPETKKFRAPNYSWVSTRLGALRNALAYTPLWVGVGLGNTYHQEDRVIYRPKKYTSYHGVVLTYIDNQFKYIFDSIKKEHKKLSLDYPILYAKSFKKLPNEWNKIKNLPMELFRKIDKKEVLLVVNGEPYWFKTEKEFNDFKAEKLFDWVDVKVVKEFPIKYNGRIIGFPDVTDVVQKYVNRG